MLSGKAHKSSMSGKKARAIPAMWVDVYLPSGSSCRVRLSAASAVRELKAEAQRRLRRGFLRLLCGGRQLDPSWTLAEERGCVH